MDDGEAFRLLNQAAQGDPATAEIALRGVLAARPDHPDALWALARLAHAQGRADVGAELLVRLVDRHAVGAEAWAALAVMSHQAGDAAGARRAARTALALAPAEPTAIAALAAAAGDLVWFARVVAVAPEDASAWRNLGVAARDLGQLTLAAVAFENVAARDPADVGSLGTLCLVRLQLGDLDGADAAYWESIRRHPDPLQRLCLDSDLALARGDRATALAGLPPLAAEFVAPKRARPSPGRQGPVFVDRFLEVDFDATELSAACGRPVAVGAWDGAPPETSIIVKPSHAVLSDRTILDALTATRPDALRVVWHLDNHHHFAWNRIIAEGADRHVAAHGAAWGYLPAGTSWLPVGLTQWTGAQIARLWRETRGQGRSDRLHGHFGYYALAAKRNRLLMALRQAMPDHDLALHGSLAHFRGLGPAERFAPWRAHKVSLCLAVNDDLPYRLFDALAAGQVPIVPRAIADLDRVIPPALQAALPIVRIEDQTVDAVQAAHAQAVAAFDRGGEAAAWDRHRYVVDHHRFAHRLAVLLAAIETDL